LARRALVMTLACYGALEIVGVIIIIIVMFALCKPQHYGSTPRVFLWCCVTLRNLAGLPE